MFDINMVKVKKHIPGVGNWSFLLSKQDSGVLRFKYKNLYYIINMC